jgi:hypothetical protein
MGLLSPLTTFRNATVTVARKAAGSRTDGVWVDGSVTSTPDVGLVMTPAGARDLKTLPEGAKIEDTKRIKTTFALAPLDEFTYGGDVFVVHQVRDWNVRGQIYFVALAIRQRIGV